jgi:hypothetical protein
MKARLAACWLAIFASGALADSWPAPKTREAFSASREYFVRVIPGESIGDTYGFGGERKGRYAAAEFYRRAADRSYRLSAEAILLNPVAPVEFFVSDSGQLATVDNWHNVGYGKVVAIYGAEGKLVRAYTLAELFDDGEIKAFPHSVSSVRWRNGPMYLRPDQKTLLITVASGVDFVFGLERRRVQVLRVPQGQSSLPRPRAAAALDEPCRSAAEPLIFGRMRY